MKRIALQPGKREVEVVVGEGEEKELMVVAGLIQKSKVNLPAQTGSQNYNSKLKNFFEVVIRVIHKGRGGKARVKFRGVVARGMKLKAVGLIKILPGAQEVDSFLDMRGLMLDGDSLIEIDPQLEIEANEVRASHAASVSSIDQVMLEFLGSVGIKKDKGEEMIIKGFLSEDI